MNQQAMNLEARGRLCEMDLSFRYVPRSSGELLANFRKQILWKLNANRPGESDIVCVSGEPNSTIPRDTGQSTVNVGKGYVRYNGTCGSPLREPFMKRQEVGKQL